MGAGAVVTKDVPDYALVYGTLAKIQGWMCQCGEQIKFDNELATCIKCGKKYTKQNQVVIEREA